MKKTFGKKSNNGVINKPKILFILQLPPPVHGSSIVGQNIKDSKIINSVFKCFFINSLYSRSMDELGSLSFTKILISISIFLKTLEALVFFRPDLCYIAPTVRGLGFYKDLPIIVLLKLFRKKIVFHLHNKGVAEYQERWFDDKLYQFAFRKIKLILLSERLYDDVKKYVDRKDVFICPNGISGQVIEKQRTSTIINLLFLSNMMAAKGVYDLLNACTILKDKGLEFCCNFIGKWTDITETDFTAAIKEKNIADRVFAYGPKYGEEKELFFKKSHIFIFPTYYHNETFGLVNIEAMQHGLPVISTNEGGIPDIVDDGITGFIVEKRNIEELANRIEKLILNPALCENMGCAGQKKFLKYYTLDIFEKRMADILTDSTK